MVLSEKQKLKYQEYWLWEIRVQCFNMQRQTVQLTVAGRRLCSCLHEYSQCLDLFQNGVERKAEIKVPRVLALGDQGSVFLHAETDRAAYCPGKEIV